MTQTTLPEAKERLPELLAAVRSGESVAIVDDGWKFMLTAFPVRPPRPRPPVTGTPKAGSCEGFFVVPDDFKEPLEEMREYME